MKSISNIILGLLLSLTASATSIVNPMTWADCPDPDVIRVGDTFYMVTTTMHLMPGAPVMRSKDLVHWETVSYVFDRLTDSPRYDLQGGTVYGRGQWATALKYHKGKFYALFSPNEGGPMGNTYIYSTDDPTGKWTLVSRLRHFHDCALFFDDDDRVYVIYGTGEMMELKQDLSDVIEGSHRQLFNREADETGLLEGSRMIKHDGRYYLLMISHVYAPGRHRREVCYRADDIQGPYEKQVILEADYGGFPYIGQGTIVDDAEGNWYGVIFQDRGAVGRVLTLEPCHWRNGWPMLGDENGRIPTDIDASWLKPLKGHEDEVCELVESDDFTSPRLKFCWQWNHNPVDNAWSLSERKGWLRLKTSRVVNNLFAAPNTLSQRMEGPQSSATISLDLKKMRDGDHAGFAAFNGHSAQLIVEQENGKKTLSMQTATVNLSDREKVITGVDTETLASVPLKQNRLWFRIDTDFRVGQDMATFFYSLDGKQWLPLGTPFKMRYDYRRLFMGSRFAIFNYATRQTGGYIDVDEFAYTRTVEQPVMVQTPMSPNKHLSIKQNGNNGYMVCYDERQVIGIPAFGMGEVTSQPKDWRFIRHIREDYRMLSGKRHHCTNEAHEYAMQLNDNVRLIMRLYNDGVAFRYEVSGLAGLPIPQEKTAFLIPEGKRRWMQTWSEGYEGFFPLSTTAGDKGRWGYPSLIEAQDSLFALISEADIQRQQSASSLYSQGDLFRVVPDANETILSDYWHTPWRVVIVGTLSDVVESTLVTDVCPPSRIDDTRWIQPGVVSWIYWAYNHGSNDYNIIKKYVDMAVTLHLPYVLIDAEWDEMDKVPSNEGKTIEDAIRYAREKGVKPLIWYNSSVGWINGAPGPKFRLNKAEDREREFAWCERLGVAGVKIDFFSGDNLLNMEYCQDLLESAARHHLLVNFHGATIPRGWQRTYPNLLSTEGVYGAEWYNNVPTFTDRAARHNATLPFTRNVIGPMDYTPCAFSDSQHPHITTHAHELALTVLDESGLQHIADRPESLLALPEEVRQFFGKLPTTWDETRLLSGYPGEFVVMARRYGTTWYIAGINGTDTTQEISLNLDALGLHLNSATLFLDGNDATHPWDIRTLAPCPSHLTLAPRGGFVVVI